MRILLVTPTPPQRQPSNAVPLVAHAQAIGLARQHHVTVLTAAGRDAVDYDALVHLQERGISTHAVWRREPVGVHRWRRRWYLASTWLGGLYPFRTVWYWEPTLQRALDDLLARPTFDIIAVEDSAMGIYRFATDVPTVFTEHEVRSPRKVDWASWRPADGASWALREADWHRWGRYQRALWPRFNRVVVFTARDAAVARQVAPVVSDRLRIVPFGIELPVELNRGRENESEMVFVGGFSHYPNVDAALRLANEIMPLVRGQAQDVRLTLVGSEPPDSIKALAGHDIIVTGRVPSIEPYVERAAVVVAPVRLGGGMRSKIVQAMGYAKAVVTSTRGVEGLTIEGESPPLLVADSTEEFAARVSWLLRSPECRRELGAKARDYALRHFSAAAYAQRLEAVYREVVEGGAR